MINKGILVLIHANNANRFSNNILFLAIPGSIVILFAIYFCSCSGGARKLSPNTLFILKENSFLYFILDKDK